jgi:hypothetical protein
MGSRAASRHPCAVPSHTTRNHRERAVEIRTSSSRRIPAQERPKCCRIGVDRTCGRLAAIRQQNRTRSKLRCFCLFFHRLERPLCVVPVCSIEYDIRNGKGAKCRPDSGPRNSSMSGGIPHGSRPHFVSKEPFQSAAANASAVDQTHGGTFAGMIGTKPSARFSSRQAFQSQTPFIDIKEIVVVGR